MRMLIIAAMKRESLCGRIVLRDISVTFPILICVKNYERLKHDIVYTCCSVENVSFAKIPTRRRALKRAGLFLLVAHTSLLCESQMR